MQTSIPSDSRTARFQASGFALVVTHWRMILPTRIAAGLLAMSGISLRVSSFPECGPFE